MGKEILMAETGAGRSVLVQRMLQKGIHIECNATVTKAQDGKIYYEQNGQEHIIDNVNTLVFAVGYHVDPAIEEMLKETNHKYHLIGDCNKVGNIKDAISTAYEIARKI
jgi:NADH dehydrogenase FAD-containing subunit